MNFKSVNIDPEIMGGTPVFQGTRVPIQTLFDYFEGGDSLQQFLDDFPTVEKEKALDVQRNINEIKLFLNKYYNE